MQAGGWSADRVDRSTATRHVPTWFGGMLGMLTTPLEPPVRGAVLICPSIHLEQVKSYRADASLATRLAMSNLAVLRFQYRGTLNSAGDASDLTLDTMVADAIAAAAHLSELAMTPTTVVGTRIGTIVGALATESIGPVPLALLAPLVGGNEYFDSLSRAESVKFLRHGLEPIGRSIQQRLTDSSRIDVLGYEVTSSLYESVAHRRLADAVPDSMSPLLVVQFGRVAQVRPPLQGVIDEWRTSGRSVTTWRGPFPTLTSAIEIRATPK
jgi:hypothetical protein